MALDAFGESPLHRAAWYGSLNVNALILDGEDVNEKNSKGQTPLHIAVKRNNKQTVQTLLEAGADTTIKDNEGMTALEIAQLLESNVL